MNNNDYETIEIQLIKHIASLEKKRVKKTTDIINSSYSIYYSRLSKVKALHLDIFNNKNEQEKVIICCKLIKHSRVSEVLSWALEQLYRLHVKNLIESKNELLLLSYSIDTWWHADDLSRVYAKILDHHKLLVKDLQYLTSSGTMWQKRISLTSLLYYSSQRENPLQAETILAQIKVLLNEDSYYIQKGLGWTLRECYNLYPYETVNFMKIYIKMISPIAFSKVTEKLNEEEKTILKYYRKDDVSNPYYFENGRF